MAQRALMAVVVVASLVVLAQPVGAGEASVFVHFVVVGDTPTNGASYDEAIGALKVELDRLAGGYTELGPTSGGFLPSDGVAETENNTSFLVAASRDMTAGLEQLVAKHFTEKPYILVWPARCNYAESENAKAPE